MSTERFLLLALLQNRVARLRGDAALVVLVARHPDVALIRTHVHSLFYFFHIYTSVLIF